MRIVATLPGMGKLLISFEMMKMSATRNTLTRSDRELRGEPQRAAMIGIESAVESEKNRPSKARMREGIDAISPSVGERA
jgi:hypothetical protein